MKYSFILSLLIAAVGLASADDVRNTFTPKDQVNGLDFMDGEKRGLYEDPPIVKPYIPPESDDNKIDGNDGEIPPLHPYIPPLLVTNSPSSQEASLSTNSNGPGDSIDGSSPSSSTPESSSSGRKLFSKMMVIGPIVFTLFTSLF